MMSHEADGLSQFAHSCSFRTGYLYLLLLEIESDPEVLTRGPFVSEARGWSDFHVQICDLKGRYDSMVVCFMKATVEGAIYW